MNANDINTLLYSYADGECSADEAKRVEAALASDPALNAELSELRQVSLFAADAFASTTPDVDLSSLYGDVMARIDGETADVGAAASTAIDGVRVQREAAEPAMGAMAKFGAWLKSAFTFEAPMASAMVAAAVALVVGGAYISQGDEGGNSIAEPGSVDITEVEPDRRGPEGEVKAAARNTAFVDNVEVAEGEVRIEINEDDPEQPMVLWHTVEGESANTGEQGL